MFAPLDQRTTIVANDIFSASAKTNRTTLNLLYFHIILKIVEDDFSEEQRLRFRRKLCSYLNAFSCQIEAVTEENGQINFLIGLESDCNPTDFIYEIKILSGAFARREMFAKNFRWSAEHEIATVSLSQVSYLSRKLKLRSLSC